ncbi:MAG: SDR family NAD(P)-dependent oxidoreductase [Saccharospirillaceae bacterium]|nr:SDR family NAD(P)-dependent oxidoreductase [Saccharospirillaceae bacterium]MCD8530435.1 SDR family NAD(P)-dependent oxidoreductase [Saccharospirillaceae bacterium]
MSKRILITGAGRRLGKVLAGHYLDQGWQVVAHYNSANELADHPSLTCLQADLANVEALRNLAQQLPGLGQFDAVIHNASCFVPDVAASDLIAHHEMHQRVHVLAPAVITEALSSVWNRAASMVCISDIYADIPNQRFSAYCAAKAGLQNFALSMAQRLAGRVRVNVIQPGPIQFLPEHDEAYRNKVLSQSLIGEELGYGAIIQACDYLLAAEALSGTVMRVDGGRFVANRYDQTFIS